MTHAPRGWRCTLPDGHDGACPLWPKGWRRLYWWWKLRRVHAPQARAWKAEVERTGWPLGSIHLPTTVYECPTCGRLFDSPSVCMPGGTLTLPKHLTVLEDGRIVEKRRDG